MSYGNDSINISLVHEEKNVFDGGEVCPNRMNLDSRLVLDVVYVNGSIHFLGNERITNFWINESE